MSHKTLHHVAIAVPNLQDAIKFYEEALDVQVGNIQELPDHGVKIVFIHLANTTIELLEPLGEESPINQFLQRNPQGGIHHLCLGDPDFKETLSTIKAMNIRTLAPPKEGAHGQPVVFLHPKDTNGALIELEQTNLSSER